MNMKDIIFDYVHSFKRHYFNLKYCGQIKERLSH